MLSVLEGKCLMYWRFLNAFIGKLQWKALCKKCQTEKYIFMPHKQEEYNDYTLQYLPAYMEKEKIYSVCLITCSASIYARIQEITWPEKYKVNSLLKKENWIRRITQFYALYEFSSKIKIISLTEPYDTCGENLLGVHGITKRELFCYDIFGFSEVPDEGMYKI